MRAGLRHVLAGMALCAAWSAVAATTMEYPGLGTVALEMPAGPPHEVVLFLSGDGGWNRGVVDMARHLTGAGALVVGIDVRALVPAASTPADACIDVAGRLEGLAHHVEQRVGLREYVAPILAGYSSGATLAYATLVQAPAGTFKAAVSLGFCPGLEWRQPLCRGEGLEHRALPRGFRYSPAQHLPAPWIALQGEQDRVCAADAARQFVARVPGAKYVSLPLVGHGYAVERRWGPPLEQAFHEVAATRPVAWTTSADVADLPLVELPPRGAGNDLFAVMLSGDGGWAGLDRAVAAELEARGVPVVGWDSLRYFWTARTPDGAARDLDRVIRHYAGAWHRPRVLLVGYSQGADVLPFMVNRLPAPTRARIAHTALIGVSTEASFEFSVTHWIRAPQDGLPLGPELARGGLGAFACIYGAEERDSPCRTAAIPGMQPLQLPGGHHFDGDYTRVATAVLAGASG